MGEDEEEEGRREGWKHQGGKKTPETVVVTS